MAKKIIILSMSCNIERFKNEEQAIRDTWGSELKNYPNMSLYFYRGGSKSNIIDFDKGEMLLKCGDGLYNTYEKTIQAFKLINNFDFDYIVKTNTTTYLNLELINRTIETLDGSNDLYGGHLLINNVSNYIPFFRGCFLMMPKSKVEEFVDLYDKYKLKGIDDLCLCKTLYKEAEKNGGLNTYIMGLKEINGVEKIDPKEYFSNIKTALYIRAKENKTGENHVEIFHLLHKILQDSKIEYEVIKPHIITKVETIIGLKDLRTGKYIYYN